MKTIVSEKGQITVPKPLRDALGIETGTVLEFTVSNGRLIGRKRMDADPFSKWRGVGRLPRGVSVDQYLRMVRDGHRG